MKYQIKLVITLSIFVIALCFSVNVTNCQNQRKDIIFLLEKLINFNILEIVKNKVDNIIFICISSHVVTLICLQIIMYIIYKCH